MLSIAIAASALLSKTNAMIGLIFSHFNFRETGSFDIVNKDRVQKFDWPNKLFVLDTGEEVPMLSKKFKKGTEEK